MSNLLPILALAAAAAVVLGKKKKKKKKTVTEPEPPDELPLPDVEEGGEPPELPPGETGLEPGKPVANGVERHFTGAYPWKILFTEQEDYAAHSYPMGPLGPHEEVARGDTVDEAIEGFKFWATNEDRRKRNLPLIDPDVKRRFAEETFSEATGSSNGDEDEGGNTGGLGS